MEMKEGIKNDQDLPEKLTQTSPQPEEIMIAGKRISRLGDRLIAVILDTFLMGAAFVVIGMSVASKLGGVTERGFSMEGKPAIITLALTIIFGFLYYWVLEGLFGVTLGKAIIGIKVIKKDGTKSDLRSSLIRNLMRIIDIIGVYLVGFFIALLSKFRQRLGDHLANTVVVEVRVGKSLRALFIILWVFSIGGGVWFSYTLHRGIPKTLYTKPTAPAPSAPEVTTPTIVSGDVKIINFRFTESKDGPVRPESPYKPGDKVYTDYNVIGFTTDQEGKLHLLYTLTAFDPAGIPLYPPYKHELHKAVPRPDEPVSGYFNFDLHPCVPSGKFNIQIKVHDSVKNTDSEFIRSFSVEGGATETTSRLEFRNFQFSLSEGGPPVTNPVIRVGERIYSQCIIAGMQFREDRPDVVIGLKIIGPKGETIIENPELIKISDSYFYHPVTFFERISAHASLPSNAPRGRYTWKYAMTDRVANTKVDYEANFEVK
ncbi:MAG: RDD family protein [Syntrophaceae bacterium]|nr:RDD family protein [Syntrophaceae bacterium]